MFEGKITKEEKENRNEKLIFKIIKEVVKIFSIVIAIIIILIIAFGYLSKPIYPITCSTYGTNYKDIKVGKRYYCCAKTEDGDYKGCIQMSDD